MSQDEKELQAILANQARREQAPDITSQVINDMKNSLVFHTRFERLLQTAPTAIASIGACFVASSSPKAQVRLSPPKDKEFQYLRFGFLQANLVECGNMGRFAFLEAENRMDFLRMNSQVIHEKINGIVEIIMDPPSARKLLKHQFQEVSRGAEDCLQASITMDKKFTDWLLFACELYAACVQQESTSREEGLSNEIRLAAESRRTDFQKSVGDEARNAQDLLEKQVAAASDTFKKASDEFPASWDIMGQQIVGDLAGAVTGALNAAIPTLMNTLSLAGTASPVPKNANDPGYTAIQNIFVFLVILQIIVAGQKDGGINWEMVRSNASSKGGAKSTISFVATMLDDAKQGFTRLATSEEPSQTLNQILNVSLQVAKDLQAVVEKSTSYPAKDTAEVKRWQADFADVYARASALLATAKTIPGVAANGIPLMSYSGEEARITSMSVQEQAVLEASKDRLVTTTQMLTTTRDNYGKSTDMMSQQQNKLADIQQTLMALTTSNISLTEIKRILFESIKLIMELKDQITLLVRFYKGIGSVLDSCMKFYVEPFLDTIKSIVSEGNDPNEAFRIGNYTLTDLQRSQVFSAALIFRSYFTVSGDIAKMWVSLSRESVFPGLKMCDELSYTAEGGDPDAMKSRIRMLSQWSQKAVDSVKRTASDKQRQAMDGMQSRIDEFSETTRDISAPSVSTLKAIENGTQATREAAQNSIEQRAKASPLNHFSIG